MDRIEQYFIEEKKTTPVVAKVLLKPLEKYEDIKSEFLYWIKHRNYDAPDAIEIGGYTAKMIQELAPMMDAAGVYSFMVTLRDNPKKAQEYIDNGFPRK